MEKPQSLVEKVNEEINQELTASTANTLLATTFKGLDASTMKKAMIEGMIRGFKFKDFVEKNVYAIPFKGNYSLITSIDYSRKIGMRSGIVGTLPPKYEEKDGKIVSCTVTVQRKIGEYVGDFSATVYFNEYFKKGTPNFPSLWETKPRTMIAKVAEMHALRRACPEEMAKQYIEEEIEAEDKESRIEKISTLVEDSKLKIKEITQEHGDKKDKDQPASTPSDSGAEEVGKDLFGK